MNPGFIFKSRYKFEIFGEKMSRLVISLSFIAIIIILTILAFPFIAGVAVGNFSYVNLLFASFYVIILFELLQEWRIKLKIKTLEEEIEKEDIVSS